MCEVHRPIAKHLSELFRIFHCITTEGLWGKGGECKAFPF